MDGLIAGWPSIIGSREEEEVPMTVCGKQGTEDQRERLHRMETCGNLSADAVMETSYQGCG